MVRKGRADTIAEEQTEKNLLPTYRRGERSKPVATAGRKIFWKGKTPENEKTRKGKMKGVKKRRRKWVEYPTRGSGTAATSKIGFHHKNDKLQEECKKGGRGRMAFDFLGAGTSAPA